MRFHFSYLNTSSSRAGIQHRESYSGLRSRLKAFWKLSSGVSASSRVNIKLSEMTKWVNCSRRYIYVSRNVDKKNFSHAGSSLQIVSSKHRQSLYPDRNLFLRQQNFNINERNNGNVFWSDSNKTYTTFTLFCI